MTTGTSPPEMRKSVQLTVTASTGLIASRGPVIGGSRTSIRSRGWP
ncbi:hypothetical protein [Actinocrinis sp.]|nr:hypothetical protein [Actinocrinis sp.]HZP49619.1 hypothetical protein [Actinocrinis sp.]